jgi:hypothetical protein
MDYSLETTLRADLAPRVNVRGIEFARLRPGGDRPGRSMISDPISPPALKDLFDPYFFGETRWKGASRIV